MPRRTPLPPLANPLADSNQSLLRPAFYRGERNRIRCIVTFQKAVTAPWRALPPRLDLAHHSPTGFEWGYGGSGPAQLALALAATRRLPRIALALHQHLKEALVAHLPPAGWHLSGDELERHLRELEAAHPLRDSAAAP